MSVSLQIYHRMPTWSRNLSASLRGYYLNSWRYDSKTEKLVEETLERDFWSDGEWQTWKEDRLCRLLNRAATRVPYYRDLWSERRQSGDRSSIEVLENWPILEKQTLRTRAAEFVADDCRKEKMFRDHTSGTTGTSLNIWSTEASVKFWYALFEARCRRWYGLSRHDRWAILGGQLIVPVKQRKPPFWVWNRGMNQLYMSSYHLAPDLVQSYIDALVRYRVRYVLGYSSALCALAFEILRSGLKPLKLDVAITNAEPLFDHQRETIAAAFGCPVRETYGMAEIVAAGSECEHGSLHQWPEAGLIETQPNEDENTSEFICTGLINFDMPLIRYKVGDRGSLSGESCTCGRTLPLIAQIDGRSDDVLFTKDGRRVGRLDPVFKGDLPIREAQIIQKSLNRLVIKYTAEAEINQASSRELSNRLRDRLGDVEVVLERVTEIQRTNRGKFRAVICELSADERASFS